MADLADETFADFPAGRPGRQQTDLAFRRSGPRRQVAIEVMSTELMLGLVRHGLAMALLTPGVVPEDPGLRTVPVIDDGPTRAEYLAWSAVNPSPATTAFLETLSRLPE